jgi:hypothetical protein
MVSRGEVFRAAAFLLPSTNSETALQALQMFFTQATSKCDRGKVILERVGELLKRRSDVRSSTSAAIL